jgi:PAS domain-containing protein
MDPPGLTGPGGIEIVLEAPGRRVAASRRVATGGTASLAPQGDNLRHMAQQPIELILARQLASGLVVPVLLVDERGDTVFFNEPAELLFGRRFDEIDLLPLERRTALLAPADADGRPLRVDRLPGMVAMHERRPFHATIQIQGIDGVLRPVETTAFPLESAGGNLEGAFVILWGADRGGGPATEGR